MERKPCPKGNMGCRDTPLPTTKTAFIYRYTEQHVTALASQFNSPVRWISLKKQWFPSTAQSRSYLVHEQKQLRALKCSFPHLKRLKDLPLNSTFPRRALKEGCFCPACGQGRRASPGDGGSRKAISLGHWDKLLSPQTSSSLQNQLKLHLCSTFCAHSKGRIWDLSSTFSRAIPSHLPWHLMAI